MSGPAAYVPLTLLAALGFAAAAVLQQAEAERREDPDGGPLIFALLRSPLWLAGMGAYVAAYGLQVWAVSLGPVVIIQPLIAAQLVFALVLATLFQHRRAAAAEWVGAAAVTVGLAGFIVATDPQAGSPNASLEGWAIAGVAVGLGMGLSVLIGWRVPGPVRSAGYGIAAGLAWGLMIVLMKTVTYQMADRGFGALFSTGYVYGLIVVAIGGFLLLQSAFAAGSLTISLVSYTMVEIVVAVVLGVLLFGEQPHRGLASAIGTAVSALVMFGGIFALARGQSRAA